MFLFLDPWKAKGKVRSRKHSKAGADTEIFGIPPLWGGNESETESVGKITGTNNMDWGPCSAFEIRLCGMAHIHREKHFLIKTG